MNITKEDLEHLAEELAYEHPVAPILEPDEILNKQTREVVMTLVKHNQQPMPQSITEYSLPPRPEFRDPRHLIRKAWDSIKLNILSRDSTTALVKRIQDTQTYARAELEYKWLESSQKKVDEALHTLHKSYTDIGAYLTNIKSGI